MALPSTPTNGQQAVLNGILYTYNSSENTWDRTPTGNIFVTGNITAGDTISAINTNVQTISAINTNVQTISAVNANVQTISAVNANVQNLYISGSFGGVVISSSSPGSPVNGQLWYDTLEGVMYVYYNDGNTAQWVDFSSFTNTPNDNFSLSSAEAYITEWDYTLDGGSAPRSFLPYSPATIDCGISSNMVNSSYQQYDGGTSTTAFTVYSEIMEGGLA